MKREIFCIICGILCFGYCLAVYGIKSGSYFYMVWGACGVFFIAAAVFLHFHLWEKLPSVIQKLAVICIAAGIILFVAVESCVISGYNAKAWQELDYIIVLGAQVKENGPSVALKFRLDAAYDYLVENESTVCIVSGRQGVNEPCSEAQGMKEYLEQKGIAPERIIMEDKARNTAENIASALHFLTRRMTG